MNRRLVPASAGAALLLLSGCVVGPKYNRPAGATPPAYKEFTPADFKVTDGWKLAQPKDDALRGKWWEIFHDPQLSALEDQVDASNQNLAAATASFFAARALVKQAHAAYFPTVTAGASITRSRQPAAASQFSSSAKTITDYSLPFDASWQVDLWGRVRNTVKASVYGAQASAADLENIRLIIHAEVAVDYYQLRGQDALEQLFGSTVVAFQQSLELTKALYETGIDSDEAVAQAETQLATARAQQTNLAISRAQFEHAIATLIGQPASTFSIPPQPLKSNPPAIPFGVPSQLLERRPDIAATERLMAQANAQIGIATAAYFPTLSLSGSAGFQTTSVSDWLTWPSRFFSVGPAVAETVFDAGLRRATVEQFRQIFELALANYRQTVLTAFQQVEDSLALLRILSQVIRQQDAAVASAERNLQLATDRYRLGIDPYLNVITAQTSLFSNQQTAVNLRVQQMTASVQLVEALGGGWDASQIPSPANLLAKSPPRPKPAP